jgi:N-acylneuraminate cytidylyltransferase
MKHKSIALIPARSGSKRVPNKNVMLFNGHPLLAYSIEAALNSKVFDMVVCATDDEEYAKIAKYYGADVPFLRSKEISGDSSPDIEWVEWILQKLKEMDLSFDIFSILRPTCPLRKPKSIKEAWTLFIEDKNADSLRAIQKCKEHPGKMWSITENRMKPVIEGSIDNTPWHSCQYAALPEIYSQNASLEIAWVKSIKKYRSISGKEIIPYKSKNLEGFDINSPDDIILLDHYVKKDESILPIIQKNPYISSSK